MSYTIIPGPNDDPSVSQSQLQTNFSLLNTDFGIDHVNYTAGSNNGLHTKTTFVSGSDPAQSTAGPELYSKVVSYPGPVTRNELFFQRASSDGTGVVQMTNNFNAPVASSIGSTFLPGGFILQWGTGTATTGGTTNNFASTFPNTCYGVVVSILSNSVSSLHSVWTSSKSTTSFVCKSDSGTLGVYYFAIGN